MIFLYVKAAVAELVVESETPAMAQMDDVLETVVREHSRLVYRVAYSVLRNRQDAEDATQETFMRLLRYRRKLLGVRDPSTWLACIAWRVAVQHRKNVTGISIDGIQDSVIQFHSQLASAEEIVLREEMSAMLSTLISSLPPHLRDALTLSSLDELAPADLAEVLGTSESSVRSRIFRARQILRERFAAMLRGNHGTK